MSRILDDVDAALADGRTVYVHCWGGIGRTGTVVGCWLMRHGLDEGDPIRRIATLRRDGRGRVDAVASDLRAVRDGEGVEARALTALVEAVLPRAWRRDSAWHGEAHWRCVAATGHALGAEHDRVDPSLVFCFGLLHDTRRENEAYGPGTRPPGCRVRGRAASRGRPWRSRSRGSRRSSRRSGCTRTAGSRRIRRSGRAGTPTGSTCRGSRSAGSTGCFSTSAALGAGPLAAAARAARARRAGLGRAGCVGSGALTRGRGRRSRDRSAPPQELTRRRHEHVTGLAASWPHGRQLLRQGPGGARGSGARWPRALRRAPPAGSRSQSGARRRGRRSQSSSARSRRPAGSSGARRSSTRATRRRCAASSSGRSRWRGSRFRRRWYAMSSASTSASSRR